MAFRTIDTDIWSNAWFYDLKPAQKVMYIFLFSNPMVSNIGVLEVSRKQFASTTGVSLPTANKFLAELEQDGQVVVDGRLILLTKFIAKQTHFGGKDTEANKNDNLVKNLRNLWAACPSEKFKRVLQETYPNLFTETQEPSDEKASPSQDPSNPLPTEKEAPSKTLGRPLQDPCKPLGSEKEGSGGDIGEYRDKGDLSIPPLYPPKGGTPGADAPAGVSAQAQEAKHAAQEQPASSPQPEAQPEQPTLSPEQPAKPKRKKGRKDRRDELPVRPQDFDRWYSLFPRKDAKQDAVCAWNDADEEGVLPEITVLEKALEWQIQANDWNPRTRRNYIPMPATYLNARRWRDEPPKFASQSFQQNTSYRPQYNTNNGGMDKFEAQRLCGQQYIEELVQQGFVTDSPSENKNNSIEAELVSPFQLPQAHM